MKALLLLAVLAGAWCVSANTVSGPLADLLDSDEQELSPSAAAVLETTADALSPADQETLASMLHDSEGIELVGSNGSGLDEELTAESEALEDAAQEEVAAAEEDAAVVEASEGTEVTDESNAIITEEGSAEEESQDEAEEMMALIALSEEDESDDEEEETADDMSESPAFIEFADEHPIMSKAEADASTILLHIAEDAYSFWISPNRSRSTPRMRTRKRAMKRPKTKRSLTKRLRRSLKRKTLRKAKPTLSPKTKTKAKPTTKRSSSPKRNRSISKAFRILIRMSRSPK